MQSRPTTPIHSDTLLSVRGLSKRFGPVAALSAVDLQVKHGEVHGIAGENGAGKSTLMHILAGVHQPDAGVVEFDGEQVCFQNEREAQRAGIAIVFQERSLFAPLTVAENIYAARQPINRLGLVDQRRLQQLTRSALDRVGLTHIDPLTVVGDLPPAKQQMVEIAKALTLNAKLLILDEPTAALTDTETRALFQLVRELRAQGVSIIHITHRLEEFFSLADRVTVLRDGTWQGTFPISSLNPQTLVKKMVGRDLQDQPTAVEVDKKQPVMVVKDWSDPEGTNPRLQGINFEVYPGEVLAFAGLAGAGRTELALALFGARPHESGDLWIDGQKQTFRSPEEAIKGGLGYAHEDRKEAGLFLADTITANTIAANLGIAGRFLLNRRTAETHSEASAARMRLVHRDLDQTVKELSGGNQQKVVLAKWLLAHPKVLIVDEPTRGVDVGAKAEIHSLLRRYASENQAGVIVISSDLPEVLSVANRVLVFREGKLVGELQGSSISEEAIMELAAGAKVSL